MAHPEDCILERYYQLQWLRKQNPQDLGHKLGILPQIIVEWKSQLDNQSGMDYN